MAMEMAMATLTGTFLQGLVKMYHPMYYNPMCPFPISEISVRKRAVDQPQSDITGPNSRRS